MAAYKPDLHVIFNDAIALASEKDRDRYIDQACGEDIQLRARVEALLRAHSEAGQFFGGKPMEQDVTEVRPGIELPGTQIGPYKLLQQIGEGGMGVVYMAEQKEPVERRVALKIIKPGMDSRQVIARFEAERQALAMMDHPNIAKVLDAGTTESGRPYFVMELVKGQPITQYCDEHQLTPHQRLELLLPVCQAIQHAHQKGIIHRDIKPTNILVAEYDQQAVPKVIDFGVAKAISQPLTEKTMFTGFGQLVGTLEYMSPEQAKVNQLDIDTRSDIYSLGVLLYELLTGSTPFDKQRLRSAAWDEMLRIIREEEPEKPSTRLSSAGSAHGRLASGGAVGTAHPTLASIAAVRGTEPARLSKLVRGELDWIVMKALEKDRNRRYETASNLAADLQRYLNDEPVQACPPSLAYRFRKFTRRHKVALGTTTMVAVTLVAGIIGTTCQAIRATRQATRASEAEELATNRLAEVAAERDAKDKALQESQSIAAFLTDLLQSPDPTRDSLKLTVSELLAHAARKLETELADQPALRTQLRGTLAETCAHLGLWEQAITLQEQVRDDLLANFGLEDQQTLEATRRLAGFYHAGYRRDEALKLKEQLLSLHVKLSGPVHPDSLLAMNSLAITYLYTGHYDQAIELQEEALMQLRKTLGPKHTSTIKVLGDLGSSYFRAGRRDEGLQLQAQTVDLCCDVYGPEHRGTLIAKLLHATLLRRAGHHEESIRILEEWLPVSRKVNGKEHPATLRGMEALIEGLVSVGRRHDVIKLREELLPLQRLVSGPDSRGLLWNLHSIAIRYTEDGRLEEALKLQEESLQMALRINGPEEPFTLQIMGNLVELQEKIGHKEEAIKLREELLQMVSGIKVPEGADVLREMERQADVLAIAGRKDDVMKLREELLPLQRMVRGPNDEGLLWNLHQLARLYTEKGRLEEAINLREESLPMAARIKGPEDLFTLQITRKLVDAYSSVGSTLAKQGKLDEANAAFRRATELDPKFVSSRNNLANSLFETGRWAEAADHFRRIEDCIDYEYFLCLLMQSDFSAYETLCRKAAERLADSNNPDELMALARSCSMAPQNALSANRLTEVARKGLSQEPDSHWRKFFTGLCLYREGNDVEAEKLMREALDKAPGWNAPHAGLALVYHRLGDREKARFHWDHAAATCQQLLEPLSGSPEEKHRIEHPLGYAELMILTNEARAVFEPPSTNKSD